MDKMTVLGVGNAHATKCFNTCYALHEGDSVLLVDTGGGNGILGHLENAGIPYGCIHDIFLSHAHCDHLLGSMWMVRFIGTRIIDGRYEGNLVFHCHDELAADVRALVAMCGEQRFVRLFDDRILFDVIADGEERDILGDHFSFFDIHSTKWRQTGFMLDMQAGAGAGSRLAFPGDEPLGKEFYPMVQGSNWLLSEAYCLYSERLEMHPYEIHHSTVKDACETAEMLGVKNLVLWHTSDNDLAHRQQDYLAEGKQYYHGSLFVPEEGDVLAFG